jgi:hypothetical protein
MVVVCAGAVIAADLADAKEAQTPEQFLEMVANAHTVEYSAKQLVVYFGDRESAALLNVRSTRYGRYVHASSGGKDTRSDAGDPRGAQVLVRPDAVFRKYDVAVGEREELLGVELAPLTLTRRSDDSLAERWWVHPSSGVVYKREQFDASGDLVGLTTITEMEWEAPVTADADPAAIEVPRAFDAPDAPQQLAGGYTFWRAFRVEAGGTDSEQWVYSDGLHALSVFRSKGHMKTPDTFTEVEVAGDRAFAGPGPGTWAFEGDGHSFVVVAEEAALDPAELLEPFPRGGGRSIWERLGSVWSELFRAIGSLFA